MRIRWSIPAAVLMAAYMSVPAAAQVSWTFTLTPIQNVLISSALTDDIFLVPVSKTFPLVDGTTYIGEVELVFADGHSRTVTTKMQVSDSWPTGEKSISRALAIWFETGVISAHVEMITVRQARSAD